MTVSKLGRTLIGAALTVVLSTLALAPASAATAPVITWVSTITDGASYVYGAVPAVPTCTAVDASAAAVDCTVSGYDLTVGTHVLTATATADEVTSTSTISYTVTAWTLKGFFRPVKTGTWVMNKVKGGSVVPFRFAVYQGTTKATSTSVVSSFTAQKVSCTDLSVLADPTAIASTKKGFSLKYRHGSFHQNWKTPKATKVTTVVTKVTHKGKKTIVKKIKTTVAACYLVTMTTTDGSALTALFKLR